MAGKPLLHHEALHTAYLISDLFDRQLARHPAIIADDDLRAKAEAISEQLGNLYQALGSGA